MAAVVVVPAVIIVVETAVTASVTAAVAAAVTTVVATAVVSAVVYAIKKSLEDDDTDDQGKITGSVALVASTGLVDSAGSVGSARSSFVAKTCDGVISAVLTKELMESMPESTTALLKRCITDTIRTMAAEITTQLVAEKEEMLKTYNCPGGNDAKKVLDKYCGEVLKQVLPDAMSTLMTKVKDAMEAAGEDAKQFTKETGNHILLISLIPFYGWVEGPIELSQMKEKCLSYLQDEIHSRVSAAIKAYKPDMKAVAKSAVILANGEDFQAALSAAMKCKVDA